MIYNRKFYLQDHIESVTHFFIIFKFSSRKYTRPFIYWVSQKLWGSFLFFNLWFLYRFIYWLKSITFLKELQLISHPIRSVFGVLKASTFVFILILNYIIPAGFLINWGLFVLKHGAKFWSDFWIRLTL